MYLYLLTTFIALFIDAILIVANTQGWLPLGLYDFIFLFVLVLAAALYRPRIIFWIFLATLPLDNIIISPAVVLFSLRPFQLLGLILILATVILFLAKKLNFQLLSFRKICLICSVLDKGNCPVEDKKSFGFWDRLVFILPIFAVLGAINSPVQAQSIKLTAVMISFVALYWLLRNYLQDRKSQVEALWFVLVASKGVLLFGLYQMLAWKVGWPHFEVMPGRINSTFTEPDWLGMYWVFILALVLWLKLYAAKIKTSVMVTNFSLNQVINWSANGYLFFIFLSILLTVARSAWLGAAGVGLVYLFLYWRIKEPMKENPNRELNVEVTKTKLLDVFKSGSNIVLIGLASLLLIEVGSLSSFHFFNRATSSFSGKQLITISCDQTSLVPSEISSVDELANYHCRHINLEEIDQEKQAGKTIQQVYRPDPNVNIRKNIYATTWQAIKAHLIWGQGLGSSSQILGQDERGAGLNASNILLETWLSLGLGGLVIILLLIIVFPFGQLANFFPNLAAKMRFQSAVTNLPSESLIQKLTAAFILLTATAIFIPNMFNSGLFLGLFWLWIAGILSLTKGV